MRTWGRLGQVNGVGGTWTEVTASADGDLSNVFLTALAHSIKLSINESPFFASVGIPAQQSIISQVFPDWYVAQMQTLYAPHFASLVMTRVPQSFPPVYKVNAVCFNGAQLTMQIAT